MDSKFQVTSRQDDDGEEAGTLRSLPEAFSADVHFVVSLKAFAMKCSIHQLLYGNTILINS